MSDFEFSVEMIALDCWVIVATAAQMEPTILVGNYLSREAARENLDWMSKRWLASIRGLRTHQSLQS